MDTSYLAQAPFFSELSEQDRAAIAPYAALTRVGAGKCLVSEGDFSYEFMVIDEGTAEVTRNGEKVAELGPGDLIGEMGVLERSVRNATVTAKTPMTLVTLTSWDARRLAKTHPQVMEQVRRVAESRVPSS